MCQHCGFYKGRMVIDLGARAKARTERMKAKKDQMRIETGASAQPQADTKEIVAEEKSEKAEATPKKSRRVKTGASSKKQKGESA